MTRRKRRGLGIFRVVLLIALLALIILVVVLILKNNANLDKEEEKKEDVISESLNEVVRISCNKYDVYFDDDNKLGFNFIIAELNFDNESGSLYYDLGYLTTSEKIKLNSVEYYLTKIKEYKYDVKGFNLLDYEFSNEGGHLTGNVFVPFLESNTYNEISIYNGEEIKFDLTKNKHNINELIYEIKTEDIKTEKYDIAVSNSYTEFELYTDTGEQFPCPLALVFEIYVNEISNNNIYIEAAKFIPDGASYSIDMIDDHVNLLKVDNAINKKLKNGDKYALIFQIPNENTITGKIMIKFSDSDNWMELSSGE